MVATKKNLPCFSGDNTHFYFSNMDSKFLVRIICAGTVSLKLVFAKIIKPFYHGRAKI